MSDGSTRVGLPARQYRRLDRLTKLAGVALVAAGLEVGGDTAAGVALATVGVACGLCTVLIEQR
ncbi:hypothetical protein [Halomicrobium salinisoli]|uniref:hypothetical protein n=1 Tax=Halomicrobium salinisoli TaxID=2878391 RepID=UPI001CF04779|nr:hypothetical protein [Halomicrobium salinisoli]